MAGPISHPQPVLRRCPHQSSCPQGSSRWRSIGVACKPTVLPVASKPDRRGRSDAPSMGLIIRRDQTRLWHPVFPHYHARPPRPPGLQGDSMNTKTMSTKITPDHLRRQALVYIRQSTTHQVRSNHESVERQYALVERAVALGWAPEAIHPIDEDQGRSGTSAVHRPGFKKLLAEISAGQVGRVLALEASRLTRSSVDWHRLVEICGITRTLLADEGAVYDPREPNDRLLLGVKNPS